MKVSQDSDIFTVITCVNFILFPRLFTHQNENFMIFNFEDCKVRSVIHFCTMLNRFTPEIHSKIQTVYDPVYVHSMVCRWVPAFNKEGRMDIHSVPQRLAVHTSNGCILVCISGADWFIVVQKQITLHTLQSMYVITTQTIQ